MSMPIPDVAEETLIAARGQAMIAASNLLIHHYSNHDNPTLRIEKLIEIASPIVEWILSGGDEDA